MFKLRPFCNLIEQNSCQCGTLHDNLSVVASVIKYYDRHSVKQFIMGKLVEFGYGNRATTSSNGYCYVSDICFGKNINASAEPLGSRVVKSLLVKMSIVPKDHVVYADKFFTSYQLLCDLQ